MIKAKIDFKAEKLANRIRRLLRDGVYTDRIPSAQALALEHRMNVKTANKAILHLAKQGLVYRQRGRGTFVVRPSSPAQSTSAQHQRSHSRKAEEPIPQVAVMMESSGHLYADLTSSIQQVVCSLGAFPVFLGPVRRILQDAPEVTLQRLLSIPKLQSMIVNGMSDCPFPALRATESKLRQLIFILHLETDLDFQADAILSDYWYGSYISARHLIGLGHRQLLLVIHRHAAMATTIYRYTAHCAAVQGFRMALEEASLPTDNAIFLEGVNNHENETRMKDLLGHPNHPTGICALGDMRAVSVMKVARQLRLSTPRDLAVIGYYDTPWHEVTDAPLSSVSLRTDIITANILRCLQKERCTGERIMVKPRLMVRGSCGGNPDAGLAQTRVTE